MTEPRCRRCRDKRSIGFKLPRHVVLLWQGWTARKLIPCPDCTEQGGTEWMTL